MNPSNSPIQDDEIYFGEIASKLWKNKILIFSFSLMFMIIGYIYSTLKPIIYLTEISLRDAPASLFDEYRPFLFLKQQPRQHQRNIAYKFNNEFKLNLLSVDTLSQFVEQNNELNEFKSYLKDKNTSAREYFRKKFKPAHNAKFKDIDKKSEKIFNVYSLIFHKPLQGENFLNDYIKFVKEKTETTFIQQISQVIVNDINVYKQNLEIAEQINLDNPILKSMEWGNTVVQEPDALFYKGKKVLSHKLVYLNKILKKTNDLTLDYNPIIEKASSPTVISKSPLIFAAIFFLLGIFLSIIIIFMRFLVQNKS